jgi:hypothetical protein
MLSRGLKRKESRVLDPQICELGQLFQPYAITRGDARPDFQIHRLHGRAFTLKDQSAYVLGLYVQEDTYAVSVDDAHLVNRTPTNYARSLNPQSADRQRIKEWLRLREEEHSECKIIDQRVSKQTRNPKRRINIHQMCVDEISADSEGRSYFALSYRWGDVQRLDLPVQCMGHLSNPVSLLEHRGCRVHRVGRDAIRLTKEHGDIFMC